MVTGMVMILAMMTTATLMAAIVTEVMAMATAAITRMVTGMGITLVTMTVMSMGMVATSNCSDATRTTNVGTAMVIIVMGTRMAMVGIVIASTTDFYVFYPSRANPHTLHETEQRANCELIFRVNIACYKGCNLRWCVCVGGVNPFYTNKNGLTY